jgi:chromate transporter
LANNLHPRSNAAAASLPWLRACATWLRIGATSFGGPAAQIALLHRTFVDELRVIDANRFATALSYCTLLPGPEAQQLATYCGWLTHGVRGALAAGTLFVLPGLALMIAAAALVSANANSDWLAGVLQGLAAATLGLVVVSLYSFARRSLQGRVAWAIAGATLLAMWMDWVPFALLLALGAGVSWALARARLPADGNSAPPIEPALLPRKALSGLALGIAIWLAPVGALLAIFGHENVFTQLTTFFSKVAVFTFGGAYSILGYVSSESVESYGWVSAAQLTHGIALAETLPGPLLLVQSYIGFFAAYQDPAFAGSVMAGVSGALLVAWATFAPSFVWIIVGAPWVERIVQIAALRALLAGVVAVAVGAMAKLALWYATHTLFAQQAEVSIAGATSTWPELASVRWFSLSIAMLALIAFASRRVATIMVLLAGALAGLALQYR